MLCHYIDQVSPTYYGLLLVVVVVKIYDCLAVSFAIGFFFVTASQVTVKYDCTTKGRGAK